MKPTTQTYGSNQDLATPSEPHPWLRKHYQEKRERTIHLVKAAVDQLVKEKQTATIEAICRKSTELDPEGRGVKKSAILENPEAHAYYRQHSTSYRTVQARKRKGRVLASAAHPLRIDPNRDVDRVRYRYLQMTKPEIVGRLLTVEQAYAELAEQQARLQFELVEIQQQAMDRQQSHKKRGGEKRGTIVSEGQQQ